ncbi:MAG: phosphoribosyl-ATP pyrophosphohydrolase/phosphoribosyl-AMP cyclohydrolase [Planctomycetota bacterium]|jgi:phosphoribosyl-ATP pyrophosphohydrolase/phosphoribosyl-AMP cyclohydrolase
MLIPSIDLSAGECVQWIGGKEPALKAGDPRPLAERFGLVGEVAVVDLDAAIGQGDNGELVTELLSRAECRVGGGIRDYETAVSWLDRGAHKLVIGTAADPALLRRLPKDRLIVALDALDGEVVVEGWRKGTGAAITDRMEVLRDYADGFLVTFVELEGRMQGTAMDRILELRDYAGDARLTVAGGITTPEEIQELDSLGVDAQVGMALYTGRLGFAEGFAAPLHSDRPDGLWPTVVTDELGRALGLCYSNLESLRAATESRTGTYWSRRRGLWKKGESSGATQELLRIDMDCDRDALRFVVRQSGAGFCHKGTATCWGKERGLPALLSTLNARKRLAPSGSYSRKLFDDQALLRAKLVEEAQELAEAESPGDVAWEAADLFYFGLVAMARSGVSIAEVESILDRRALQLTRRSGGA